LIIKTTCSIVKYRVFEIDNAPYPSLKIEETERIYYSPPEPPPLTVEVKSPSVPMSPKRSLNHGMINGAIPNK
jgi:hypothetical protein